MSDTPEYEQKEYQDKVFTLTATGRQINYLRNGVISLTKTNVQFANWSGIGLLAELKEVLDSANEIKGK